MIKIYVFIKDKNWKKYISNPNKYLNKLAKKINLNIFSKSLSVNFSIQLTGNKEIKNLNKKFRKKNKTTISYRSHIMKQKKQEKIKAKKNLSWWYNY